MKSERDHVRKRIRSGTEELSDLMRLALSAMADDLIERIVVRYERATPAQRINATKDIKVRGAALYLSELREALARLALDTIQAAKKEVPTKKKKLSDLDDLPPKVRKRILKNSQLLVGTQIGDLEKAVFFQFLSSFDTTSDAKVLRADLFEAAEDLIEGPSIAGGAAAQAAQTVIEARNSYFFDADTLEEIAAFEFVNGDPVSPICQDLAGTIFAKDDPEMDRYMPPLHFNCKSYIRPILQGNLGKKEITRLRPSKSDLEKYIQFSEEPVHSRACFGIDRYLYVERE